MKYRALPGSGLAQVTLAGKEVAVLSVDDELVTAVVFDDLVEGTVVVIGAALVADVKKLVHLQSNQSPLLNWGIQKDASVF